MAVLEWLDIFGLVWSINSITTVLVFLFTFTIIYVATRRQHGIPPGPAIWPLIGNLPSLASTNLLERLEQIRQKYGDIVGLYIGSELNIFLNGYDVIHDALVKNGTMFSRRPMTRYATLLVKKFGIVLNNGEPLKKNRAFVLSALRHVCFYDKGLGIEDKINEEIACFLDTIGQTDQPFNPSILVNLSFSNVMFTVIHGRRIGYEDSDFQWYMVHLDEAFKTFKNHQLLLSCLPFVTKLPFDVLNLKFFSEANEMKVRKYHQNMCEYNFENYVEGSNKCLVDCYLTSVIEDSDNISKNKNYSEYFDDNLWLVLHDMMAAGSETSATTLKWIMIHVAMNPEIQTKIQDEIDSVLRPDQTVSLTDRGSMPFVEATILEGLRIGTVVPLAIPHSVVEDTLFRGYLFRKDVQVFVNVASVLKDPKIFPEPDVFRPERFLSKDMKSVVIPKVFIPFSLGPRSCIGETLAKMELFLYTATLFQKFDLKMDPTMTPTLVGEFELTYHPKDFRIFFNKRH